MKKTIISCVLFLTAVTAFSQTPMKTAAEAKLSASDLAVKIADRILATTTYEFKNTKTGKTYKSVKNLQNMESEQQKDLPHRSLMQRIIIAGSLHYTTRMEF